MEIKLTPEEHQLLVDILSNQLAELRSEISNTENYNLRQSLKDDETTLRALLERLQQTKEVGL